MLELKAALATAWSALTSPVGRIVAASLAVLLALLAVHHHGYRAGESHQKAVYAAAMVKAQAHVAKIEKDSAQISAKAQADNAAANARIAALTLNLQSKVKTYVTPEADRRCVIPAGYVRLRDAAGTGLPVVPGPAGQPVDADSGLALSDLAANDIVNAASFNILLEEVKAWRGWYVAQADLWSKNIKASPMH